MYSFPHSRRDPVHLIPSPTSAAFIMTFAGWERMDFDLLRIPAAPWLLLAAVLCSLAYLIYKHRWNQTSVVCAPTP